MLLTAFLTIAMSALGAKLFAFAGIGTAAAFAFGACAQLGACKPCPDAPVPADWTEVDSIDPNRGAKLDSEVTIEWGGVDAKNTEGWHGHFRALRIRGRLAFTVTGTNDAVSWYQLRSMFYDIHLNDIGDSEYLVALDGRNCIDDGFMRGYRLPEPPGDAIPAALPAGDYTVRIDLLIPLVSRVRGSSPTEGLILVSALQGANGSNAMTFRTRDGILGAPQDVTPTGFLKDDGSEGLTLDGDLFYHPIATIDAPWQVRGYSKPEFNGLFDSREAKHGYLIIRQFPEDAAGFLGQQLVAGLDDLDFKVDGEKVGETRLIDMVTRQNGIMRSAMDSAANLGLQDLSIPAEPGVTLPMLVVLPYTQRENAPAGPVSYKISTHAGGYTQMRFLHRTTFCDDQERYARIESQSNCGPCAVYQPGNPVPGITDRTAPKLLVPITKGLGRA